MNPRPWLFAIVLGAAPVVFWSQGAEPEASARDTSFVAQPTSLPRHMLMGAGSCAAAACHNNYHHPDNRGEHIDWLKQNGKKNEPASIWLRRDPHARAYEVLFHVVAVNMQKKLHRKHGAHEDPQCLKCHAAPEYDEKNLSSAAVHFKKDGVSCESCHGPASNWIGIHHLDDWQTRDATYKKRHGMNDTRSLVGRAQACVRCHVGEEGMDVDHELIAAGHPRLNFEFAAFHAGVPRHWPDEKSRTDSRGVKDLDARAWAVGQLVSAHAALKLLAVRAEEKPRADNPKEKTPWPEFAEHDCFACHHDLRFPRRGLASPRQLEGFGNRRPGVLPWGNYHFMTRIALSSLQIADKSFVDALNSLQDTMDKSIHPDRQVVSAKARTAASHLDRLLTKLETNLPDVMPTDTMLKDTISLHDKGRFSVDEKTRVYLAAGAFYQTRLDLKQPFERRKWDGIEAKDFEPKSIKVRLANLEQWNR